MESIAQLRMKKTELGWLPEDWEVIKLKSAAHLKSGDAITSKKIDDAYKYPCYGGNGLRGYAASFTHNGKYGIIGRQGALCGNVYTVSGKFFASEHAIVVSPNSDTHIDWLVFLLDYMNLNQYSESSAQPGLSVTKVNKLKIPLPPLPEQQAIAQVLSDMDALIQQTTALIEKKQRIKEGTMQTLLTGKTRVKGFEGSGRYQQTELGAIPEEWEVSQIGNHLKIKHGKSQKNVESSSGHIPILGTGGVIGFANQAIYTKPSVLIGRKGTINKPMFMETPFWTIDTLFYSEIKDNVVPKFIYLTFLLVNWLGLNEASGVPSLSASNIENVKIPLPPLKEQQAIAQILSDMDAELDALAAKLEKYEYLKQGMMQTLLMGQIRLC